MLMRSSAIAALVALAAGSPLFAQRAHWEPAPGHTQIPLWPGAAAGRDTEIVTTYTEKPVAGRPWNYIQYVSRPTITVYSPTERNTGAAMIVFPGGGYQILAIDLEGTEVCDWLVAKGVTCVLLKYRVPHTGPDWNEICGCFLSTHSSMALEDAQRAISLVRFHADQWQIDPHKIGVIGFSAGGHMVASVSTRFAHRVYAPKDAADKVSCRPDFAIALYPGHLVDSDGRRAKDLPVSASTPPTFLVQAENDPVDSPNNALSYYTRLKDAKVPVELHMYAEGGHAFGLRPTKDPITHWPALVESWLRTIGMIAP